MEQFQSAALLVPELKELLQKKDYALLKQIIRECNPLDFADVWRSFSEGERLQIFRLLNVTSALKLFEILEIEDQRFLLEKLSEEGDAGSAQARDNHLENSVGPMLENMNSPDLAKIFNTMPPRAVKKMKSLIRRQQALTHIDYLMKFPENSAGSLMHPEFVRLGPRVTSKQALNLLQAIVRPNQKEHLYSLFVTDEPGRALGWLSLQDLLSSPEDERLGEFMNSIEGIKVKPDTDQEEIAKIFAKYQINAAPVVDDEGKLLGVVTLKDMISIVKQEATEDIAKMAGTQASAIEESSVFRSVGLRMPWLVVTLIGGTMISMVIRSFEPILAKVIALAAFSPLIAGMGGNVGSQSATIIVRRLALGKLDRSQKMKTIYHEMGIGWCLGGLYGLLLGLIAYVIYGGQYGHYFSLVVVTAMWTAMTVAATMGAVGPLLLDRMKIDPATATGPLVTTITDIISNIIYFSLATLLLSRF